jgi:hypothetical protein
MPNAPRREPDGRHPEVPDAEGPVAGRGRRPARRAGQGGVLDHEEFLAACLQREVAARESHGEGRIRAARFPARKALEDFDYDHQRSLKREVIAHLATFDFITSRDNVVFLGRLGTGKTHLSAGLGVRPARPGTASRSRPPPSGSPASGDAHHAGHLQAELVKRWGEVFGDDTVAAAMIDRLVHHAEVISLKGDSYRLKNRDLGRIPAATTND